MWHDDMAFNTCGTISLVLHEKDANWNFCCGGGCFPMRFLGHTGLGCGKILGESGGISLDL
jgi:hypothetical protein